VDIAADSQSILAHVSAPGALMMLEFDLAPLAPIRAAKINPYYAYFPRGMVALPGGDMVQVYNDRIALLSPNDYVAAVPTMFKAECDPGEVVDRFNDPSSGWPIFDNTMMAVGYIDNTYSILHRQPDRLTAVTRGDFWANSELVEVSGWRHSGKGSYGIIFGWADDSSEFYILEIVPDSKPENREAYLLHYTKVSGWELLQGFELPTVIRPGEQRNTMRLSPYSDEFGNVSVGIYINGYRLQTGLPYFVGRVGLIGSSSPESASELRFDDYRFTANSCAPSVRTGPDLTSQMTIERPPLAELRRAYETIYQPNGGSTHGGR
jgi:hypothetical protein